MRTQAAAHVFSVDQAKAIAADPPQTVRVANGDLSALAADQCLFFELLQALRNTRSSNTEQLRKHTMSQGDVVCIQAGPGEQKPSRKTILHAVSGVACTGLGRLRQNHIEVSVKNPAKGRKSFHCLTEFTRPHPQRLASNLDGPAMQRLCTRSQYNRRTRQPLGPNQPDLDKSFLARS